MALGARLLSALAISACVLGSCIVPIDEVEDENGSGGSGGSGGSAGSAGSSGSGASGSSATGGSGGSDAAAGTGGAAGSSGGAPPEVAIRSGLSSLVGVSAEASYPVVNLDKSVLFMGRHAETSEPETILVEGALTSDSTASFTRYEALGTSALVRWYVVEHANLHVQRGNLILLSTSQVLQLPAVVDAKRSFVMISYKAGGTQMGGNDFVSAKLLSGDSFQIQASDVGASVSWQVAELTDASRVISTSATLTGDNTTVTVPIEPVDPARSFLIFSYRMASNPSLTTPVNVALRGRLQGADSVSFTREGPGTFTLHIELSVVELAFGSVAHQSVTLPAGTASVSFPTSADPTTGIAFATAYGWAGSSEYSTNDTYSEAWIAAALEPSQVVVSRGKFSTATRAEIEVVDFVK